MDTSWLSITPSLREALGPGVIAQLAQMDPLAPITCQVCGRVKRAGVRQKLAVVAAVADDGTYLVGFAHRQCRARSGDLCMRLLDGVNAAGGVDALAFFGVRGTMRPHAILAYEGAAIAREVLSDTEGRDAIVAAHLATGFTLVMQDLLETHAAPAPEWTVRVRGGELTVEHPTLGVGYQQRVTPEVEEWLEVARNDRGQILVVTGTELGIAPGNPPQDGFDHARRRGLLVAAVVDLREEL